jgi:hypothetical protein
MSQGLASGTISLAETSNYGSIYLVAGKSGARWLHQHEIAEEERHLRTALPYFFQEAQPRAGRCNADRWDGLKPLPGRGAVMAVTD